MSELTSEPGREPMGPGGGVAVRARVDSRDLDVSLALAAGETLALLGPNGAGKSSTLAVLAGLLTPDEGTVRVGGRVLTAVGPGRARVRTPPHARRTALLGQDALLFPHLSALENVAFGPRSAGTPRRRARQEALGWLEEVGAADLAARRPGQLSGGEAQRVAIARALATQPALLLLDEPMAALDVAFRPAVRQTLRRVLADRTAVLVTHDPLDALLLADRVIVMDAGRVVEDGPSRDVLARPRSAFGARMAGLNLVVGTWRDDAVRADGWTVHGRLEGPRPSAGAPAVASFRPTAVAVYPSAPEGSPRNAFDVTLAEVEPLGDLIRLHGGGLHADVTVQAAAELRLDVGRAVSFVVKATEVSLYAG